jgi:hypothetical protein
LVNFLAQQKLIVPLKEFSPTKLQKTKRLHLILDSLQQGGQDVPFPLTPDTSLATLPWFTHEKNLFAKLSQILPFVFQWHETANTSALLTMDDLMKINIDDFWTDFPTLTM